MFVLFLSIIVRMTIVSFQAMVILHHLMVHAPLVAAVVAAWGRG
jgi:hypothetical protein